MNTTFVPPAIARLSELWVAARGALLAKFESDRALSRIRYSLASVGLQDERNPADYGFHGGRDYDEFFKAFREAFFREVKRALGSASMPATLDSKHVGHVEENFLQRFAFGGTVEQFAAHSVDVAGAWSYLYEIYRDGRGLIQALDAAREDLRLEFGLNDREPVWQSKGLVLEAWSHIGYDSLRGRLAVFQSILVHLGFPTPPDAWESFRRQYEREVTNGSVAIGPYLSARRFQKSIRFTLSREAGMAFVAFIGGEDFLTTPAPESGTNAELAESVCS